MPIVLSLLVLLLAAPPAHAGSWRRPVQGPLLRAFEVGANPYAAGQHRGVDLAAPLGAAVRSACSGRVSFAGRVPGGGLTVSTRCGPLIATYQHLGVLAVRRGQAVRAGARLGTIGRSGKPAVSTPHVHLGVREAASGRYVDPLSLFGGGTPGLPPGLGPAPRARPPRLGPAPLRAPRLRPAPRVLTPRLGPAPLRAPRLRPAPDRPMPRLGPGWSPPIDAGPSAAGRVGWLVWVGLGCVGLGLPLGGFVHLRRRRRAIAVAARMARSV